MSISSFIDGDEFARKESKGDKFYKHNFFKHYNRIVRSEKFSNEVERILFFTHESKSSQTRYSFHGDDVRFVMDLGEFRGLEMDVEIIQGVHSIHVCESIFYRIATYIVTKVHNRIITIFSRSLTSGSWELKSELSPGDLSSLGDFIKNEKDQDSFGYPRTILMIRDKKNSQENHPCFFGIARCTTMDESQLLWFILKDKKEFDHLETLMNQLNVREVLIEDKLKKKYQDTIYNDLTEKLNECCKTFRVVKVVKKNSMEITRNLVDHDEFQAFQTQNRDSSLDLVYDCVATLSREHDLEGDDLKGFMRLKEHKMDNFMKLDMTALHALNILPAHDEINKDASLAGLLKHTLTRMGDRRLMNWIRQPLVSVVDIEKRQKLVEMFMEENEGLGQERSDNIRSKLRYCPDLDSFVSRLMENRASLKDVCKVYQFTTQSEGIVRMFRELRKNHEVFRERYERWKALHDQLGQFEGLIERSIDIDKLKENEYFVHSDFSVNLAKYSKKIEKYSKKMKKEMNKLCDDVLDIPNLKENTRRFHVPKGQEREYGWCLKITGNERKKVNQLKKKERKKYGLIEIKNTKSSILLTSEKINHYAVRTFELKCRYKEEQKDVADKVLDVCKSYHQPFCELIEEVSLLDIVRNFAELSSQNNWVRPVVVARENQEIEISGGRHPCVEKTLIGLGGFIKNELHLRHHPETNVGARGPRLVLITGPNMGGKSTYIRQNALIVLMAQIGCNVPADDAKISVRDGIYARIGANDSQYDGLSTFMAEMVETKTILQNATPYSLLVIDELGRGTSTYEGLSIAHAMCRFVLDDIGCFCLFATHFHQLASLEMERKDGCVKNFHVNYDKTDRDRVTLLYELKEGFCDESFGIEVTKKCNYPPVVIEESKSIVEKLKRSSSVLSFGGDESESRRKRIKREADEVKRGILREFGQALSGGEQNHDIQHTVLELKKKIQNFMGDDQNDIKVRRYLTKLIHDQR